ncbi:MAG: hypothetical protein EBV74_00905 [Alphaproteobacteria bacterium]|jgi:hypothetical protein|nr:hypothetical protein [Candidatus Fonsibacter sp. PEL55]
MRAIIIILLTISLNSCGSAITAGLVETVFSPSSIITSVVDYGIEKETGKKVSEHALSAVTSKDCKLGIQDIKEMSICKDENFFDKITTTVTSSLRNSYTRKID